MQPPAQVLRRQKPLATLCPIPFPRLTDGDAEAPPWQRASPPALPALLCFPRAAAYSKLGNYTGAVQDCERAICIDPSYSKAYGRMG